MLASDVQWVLVNDRLERVATHRADQRRHGAGDEAEEDGQSSKFEAFHGVGERCGGATEDEDTGVCELGVDAQELVEDLPPPSRQVLGGVRLHHDTCEKHRNDAGELQRVGEGKYQKRCQGYIQDLHGGLAWQPRDAHREDQGRGHQDAQDHGAKQQECHLRHDAYVNAVPVSLSHRVQRIEEDNGHGVVDERFPDDQSVQERLLLCDAELCVRDERCHGVGGGDQGSKAEVRSEARHVMPAQEVRHVPVGVANDDHRHDRPSDCKDEAV
mmetsp:Transcript_16972/g.53148  ORF Transcript_16972/g.53148 Transcript_16972/m.53148 type:complete len:270 (+) Transcript_16972:434-1243(+)